MAVLRPLKVVITNYPEGEIEELDAVNNPEDPAAGSRTVPFGRELYIERDDFMEEPPKKFFRLAPGREVRLRYAYLITCQEVVKDAAGEVVELRCSYDPATRGGNAPDGRQVKATLHWVSAAHAVPAEVRLYDHLFNRPRPGRGRRTSGRHQPATRSRCCAAAGSSRRLAGLPVEARGPVRAPGLLLRRPGLDRRSCRCSTAPSTLRDTWAKIQAKGEADK